MSILIIKSGTTSIAGGTVKGDFTYFSATTKALGGTIDTGFWSGVDPTCDGYTVYKIGGQHGWAAMVATGREQLNYYLKLFGGTGTTTDENVTWATNANNIFLHSGSTGPCPTLTPTATSGLVTPTPTSPPSTPTPTPSVTPTANKSLVIHARDVATNRQNVTLYYTVNYGPSFNIPGATATLLPITCTQIYTITGLSTGDVITINTNLNCVIEGTTGFISCPSIVGSSLNYTYTMDAPSTQAISLTVDTSIIPV
jgi:hypothetical protein